MTDAQNKVFYTVLPETDQRIRRGQHPALPLPNMTTLKEGWVMPNEWKEWCIYHYHLKPAAIAKFADRFKVYHIINNKSSRNWFAMWKVWIRRELLWKTEVKKYIPISEKLCPSCQKKFKD